MIIYDLVCGREHRFEGWFRNNEEYRSQIVAGELMCPVCGSVEVRRVPTAGHVARHGTGTITAPDRNDAAQPLAGVEKLRQLHDYVERNFEYVGNRFADEARRIHRGEIEERNIRGEASRREVASLTEEGIVTLPLPPKPPPRGRLN